MGQDLHHGNGQFGNSGPLKSIVKHRILQVWVKGWDSTKTAEPIEMSFGGWLMWFQGTMLDGVKIGRIHSHPQGVTNRRCGFLLNYFGHLLLLGRITTFARTQYIRIKDAACCYRRSSVVGVCWSHSWALQKRLNRLRCRLEGRFWWARRTVY